MGEEREDKHGRGDFSYGPISRRPSAWSQTSDSCVRAFAGSLSDPLDNLDGRNPRAEKDLALRFHSTQLQIQLRMEEHILGR